MGVPQSQVLLWLRNKRQGRQSLLACSQANVALVGNKWKVAMIFFKISF